MIYIISGTVRAGTSMMAEMLKQGGIPLLYNPEVPNTDPTDDFCHNTFTIEEQMKLVTNPDALQGHVIKLMVRPLLGIPVKARPTIKMLWMQRSFKCILASISHSDVMHGIVRSLPTKKQARFAEKLWRKWVTDMGISCLQVKYERCVKRPRKTIERVVEFLEYPNFDIEKAVAVVDPKKWRQR